MKETKCANFRNCNNEKEWDKNVFFQSNSDIEKIKMFFCKECYDSKPIQRWITLKRVVMNNLKNS